WRILVAYDDLDTIGLHSRRFLGHSPDVIEIIGADGVVAFPDCDGQLAIDKACRAGFTKLLNGFHDRQLNLLDAGGFVYARIRRLRILTGATPDNEEADSS